MRRILIIAAVIIALLGTGAFVYFRFFAGSSSTIATTPSGTTNFPSANPSPSAGTPTDMPETVPAAPTTVSARLVKISAGPAVPGEAVVDQGTASSSDVSVSYIERESGNVFSYLTRADTITRISNRTLPGIQSAYWLPNASSAFVQYLSGDDFSTINTYALPASSDGSTQGFFLPQDLAGIAVSSTSVLTLASGANGSVASIEKTDGTHSSQIFTTPLSAVRVSFAGKGKYLAFSKPSAELAGDAFLVDSAGDFSRVAGPLNGLVALPSPDGKWALVSYTSGSAMQMELVDTETGQTTPLPVATIADKCVWAADDSAAYCGIPENPPSATYPDDWYQGAVHFSDRIWKIDVASRYAELVLDFPKETNDTLDATALAVDPLGTELVFVNKNDGSLWGYQL